MNQKNQNQFGAEDNQDKSLSNSQQSQNNAGSKTPPEQQKKNLDEQNRAAQFSNSQNQDQQKEHGHQYLGQQGARQSDMGGKRNKSSQQN